MPKGGGEATCQDGKLSFEDTFTARKCPRGRCSVSRKRQQPVRTVPDRNHRGSHPSYILPERLQRSDAHITPEDRMSGRTHAHMCTKDAMLGTWPGGERVWVEINLKVYIFRNSDGMVICVFAHCLVTVTWQPRRDLSLRAGA